MCVYMLAVYFRAVLLMITSQLVNEERNYEFGPHSCVTPFRIKAHIYIALTKAIPNILDYFIYRLIDLEDWPQAEY